MGAPSAVVIVATPVLDMIRPGFIACVFARLTLSNSGSFCGCCMMFMHLQTQQGKEAQSTVQMEAEDNLKLVIDRFRNIAGTEPRVVMDNIRIQAGIDDQRIEGRDPQHPVLLPEGHRIRIPTHSPDCNQVAEHSIAALKDDVIRQLYEQSQLDTTITAEQLRLMGKKAFERFEQGQFYKGGVAHNVARMPDVWGLIATPSAEEYTTTTHTEPHHNSTYHGTGGDWAPPGWN